MAKRDNLNDATINIRDPDGVMGDQLLDFSTLSDTSRTIAYFKDIESRLIEHIQTADIVFGCVAWLTSEPILSALTGVNTSIVVQKEDFLRPDTGSKSGWPRQLRGLYDKLHCDLARFEMPGCIQKLSMCGDPSVDPVRCVGNHNASKAAASPRSHHKFVVFGEIREEIIQEQQKGEWKRLRRNPGPEITLVSTMRRRVEPYAVWTGSYNFTKNAGRSFENAVYMEDPAIVQAFVNEFAQIFALSEPLDWTSN